MPDHPVRAYPEPDTPGDLGVGRCAQLPLTIRWFHEFEIPKIRLDFGWRDYGAVDENRLGLQRRAPWG